MPSFKGNLLTQRHQITLLETRDSRLSYGEDPESLSHLELNPYRVVTDGQTDRIPIANTRSQQYLPVQLSRAKTLKNLYPATIVRRFPRWKEKLEFNRSKVCKHLSQLIMKESINDKKLIYKDIKYQNVENLVRADRMWKAMIASRAFHVDKSNVREWRRSFIRPTLNAVQ